MVGQAITSLCTPITLKVRAASPGPSRGWIFFLFPLWLLWAPHCQAQIREVQLTDAATGHPIAQANVTNRSTGESTATDKGGNSRIHARPGERVHISHVSYLDRSFTADEDVLRYRISLDVRALAGVEIYEDKLLGQSSALGANNSVSLPFLTAMPSFLGEPDVLKSLSFLPGVSAGNEGYSHLLVRGGNQDQNLLLLDGATMVNVNHFGGFISMFHPEMIEGVNFHKSYWPSKYGGRLSSVVDIHTAEGSYTEHRQAVQLGIFGPKIRFEGPVLKNRVSYHIGGRRTLSDLITRPIARKIRKEGRTGDVGDLLTQDFNFRLDARLNNSQKLFFSGLWGRDGYSFIENYPEFGQYEESDYRIKNEVFTVNYTWDSRKSTRITGHASYSGYRHFYEDYSQITEGYTPNDMYRGDTERINRSGNAVRSFKVNLRGKSALSSALEVQYGMEREWLGTELSLRQSESLNGHYQGVPEDTLKRRNAHITSVFSDVRYSFRSLSLNMGARLSRYSFSAYGTWLFEPKVRAAYAVSENSSVQASFNYQRQPIALLGWTDDMGRFREFYVSSERIISPSTSRQASIGYAHNRPGFLDSFSVEVFLKNQSEITRFSPSFDFERNVFNYENHLHLDGKRWVFGTEFLMQKTMGRLQGSLSYTYAHARSSFSSLHNGDWFDSDFDMKHNANALLIYSFGKGYRLSGHWTYNSGRPFTMPTSETGFEELGADLKMITGINNRRMPSFHRLDINLERKWRSKKDRENWFGVGIYNVYNRVNPFFVRPDEVPGKLEVTGMFPLIPFFYLGFEL